MSHRLTGRVALVTGAASGIGEGIARRFAEEGARVVLADLQEEAGAQLAAELGDGATFVRCDVTLEADVAAAVDTAVDHFGQLDVMVNNAGILGAVGPIAETPVDAFDATMAVHARGVFLGMKHAARVMQPRGSGAIISTASTAGIMGGLGPHVYTMAKHGIVGLTRSVASELSGSGIRVNAVAPGGTVSGMTSYLSTGDPDGTAETEQRLASGSVFGAACMPIDIANAVLYLACDESRFVTGHTLTVDSGQTTAPAPAPFHTGEVQHVREAGRTGIE